MKTQQHLGNNILKRKAKLALLEEMPVQGKKKKTDDDVLIISQEGEFDDDSEMEQELKKFMLIKMEEKEKAKNAELLEKRQRYIRLMNMWIKILDHYSVHLHENEIKRITEGVYFLRCEDFDAKQLTRLESRAINIIRTKSPVFIPNARKLPDSILKVSLIDKRKWIDPCKVQKADFYGTINKEIENQKTFEYLYQKAKELGKNQTKQLS